MNRNFIAVKVFIVALFGSWLTGSALAANISIYWEPSPSDDVAGYAVYYGNKSGSYSTRVDAGNQTNFVFQPADGSRYYFVVTAYTSEGLESLPSEEVAYEPDVNVVQMTPGTFNGLFDLAPLQQSLGSFTLKKGNRNTFSGSIKISGRQYRFSGKPDASTGNISININRRGASPLVLTLNVDSNETEHLTGTLSDGSWTMQLNADRATFNAKTNAAPYVGKYTFAVLGISGEELTPGGIGFGSVTVLSNGMVRARGTLGDGKNFSAATWLSEDGVWPFYVSAYGRFGGSIGGWLQFETNGAERIHGDLSWIKPTIPRNKFYPAGFTNSVGLIGSSYFPRGTTNPVLDFTNGTLTLAGADLVSSFAKDVIVSTNRIIPAVVGEDALAFRITKNSGLFSGTIRLPDSKIPIRFRGSLLQNQNAAYGLFLRTNQVGELRLEALP